MSLTIGIDAGGTSTKALILNSNKQILFKAESGFGNPNVNYERAFSHIAEVMELCLLSRYGEAVKEVVVGIAGIEAGSNRERLKADLSARFSLPILMLNDAELAYYAVLDGEDGILTIAGTGSVCFGRKGEKTAYTGGWGHLLGDEGSAYDIAISACKMLIQEEDQGKEHSPLSLAIMKSLGIKQAHDLKTFIYGSSKGEIASLSMMVYEQAKSGDEAALQFFSRAGEKLGVQASHLLNKLQLTPPFLIGCKGSLLEKNEFLFEAFKGKVTELSGESKFILENQSSAIGAIAAVKRLNGCSEERGK